MLERAVMVYLAFTTVVTAAIFPIPLRTAAAARAQRPSSEPPLPARDEGITTVVAVADAPSDECIYRAEVTEDCWDRVVGELEPLPDPDGELNDEAGAEVVIDEGAWLSDELMSEDPLDNELPTDGLLAEIFEAVATSSSHCSTRDSSRLRSGPG